MFKKTLHISTSPHLRKGRSTENIMLQVIYALLPVTLFSIYSFGINALLVILTAVGSSVLTEHVLCRISGRETTIGDYSAVITGLLLGLILPPSFPLWMTFVGGIIAIGLGKFAFGGLGQNAFNPALVGRAVLQAAFPVAITTWFPAFNPGRFTSVDSSVLALPFTKPMYDSISGATPLSAFKFDNEMTGVNELFLGEIPGSIGETSSFLILVGGIYLIVRKMMNWRIPVSIILTVYVLALLLHTISPEVYPDPFFMVFSGGLMLGAFFMASDMVGSPITHAGVVIYGVLIGVLVVVIRYWAGLPEGVMYAILLGNAMTPQIDNLLQNSVYGTVKRRQHG